MRPTTDPATARTRLLLHRRAGAPATVDPLLRLLLGQLLADGGALDDALAGGRAPEPDDVVVAQWLAVPSAGRLKLFVPIDSRAAAARSVRVRADGDYPTSSRLKRYLLALSLRTGVAQRLIADRVEVRVSASQRSHGLENELLPAFLRSLLGTDVVVGGENFDPDPHKNQVLHALDLSGRPAGFVKLARNRLSHELLRSEAGILRRVQAEPIAGVTAPNVLHHGRWGGRDILVTQPLVVEPRAVPSREIPPPLETTLAIAELGPRHRARLADSAYWLRTRDRLSSHLGSHTDAEDAIALALRSLEPAAGDAELEFGAWHGDWVPWNFSRAADSLLVWDWEYYSDAVPLGFDVLHFYFGVGFFARRLPAGEAATRAGTAAAGRLRELGLDAAGQRLVVALYAIEMLLRRLDIRRNGGGRDDDRVFPDLPSLVASTVRNLSAGAQVG